MSVTAIIAACGTGGGGDGEEETTGSGSISGRLIIPAGVVTDSDVNDSATSPVSNNSGNEAQSVPNPVSIGGYVNQPNMGDSGNSYASGDTDDYFLADLAAGQTLMLTIADLETADLDLYLYDSNGTLVDDSTGTSRFESIVVPTAGQYYVNVYAYSGASNYLLSIGLTPAANLPPNGYRLSDDFIPGDVLVKFKDSTTLQAKSLDTTLSHFDFPNSAGNALSVQKLTLNQYRVSSAAKGLATASLSTDDQLKYDTLTAIKELKNRDDVEFAEPNYRVYTKTVPNDEYYNYQWHYPLINLPQAWDITTGSSDVIVSVIDTGILFGHPDAPARLVDGYDFISDPEAAGDGNGIDNNPEDNGDKTDANANSSFHGTHVAGTVAANTNNSIGVAGVAWGVKVMPIRALGKGGGTAYDIAQSILYSAGLANDSGTTPSQRADIINMSLGGGAPNSTSQNAINAARNAGVIIFAASGNENTSVLSYPASYPGVVSVAAVDINRERAPYSNYGSAVDIAAPGGNTLVDLNGDSYKDGVLSTLADDSSGTLEYAYVFYDGTSMATPHAAGVAALMKSVYPGLTPDEFDNMLAAGELTSDLGAAGRDDLYGYGLFDAFKAVQAAQARAGTDPTPTDPALNVSPKSLNFSTNLQSASLYVEEVGGTLGSVQVTENIAWLTVTPTQVDASGYGTYTLTVDRSSLTPATYSGDFQISAGTENVMVSVIMQVSDTSVSGDVGQQYVLLIDADTKSTVMLYDVDGSGSSVGYSFSNVPAGDYYLLSGSDMDMDDYVCDSGESCGYYPSLSQKKVISVDSNSFTDMDFTVNFEFQAPTSTSNEADGTSSGLQGYSRIITE
ncbi:MAG: S8 family serine peptidase [Candidatus Thiodiazotropha sp.]